MDKLRQITADITVATANASRHSTQHGDRVESRSCQYDSVMSAASTKVDTSNVSADVESGRFVSNKSMTLSPATLPPAVAGTPPRTRTTMREMQDSSSYTSFTSPKDPPVCPPATAVRQRPLKAAADIEKEWRQIVYAAETVIESSNSVNELSDTSTEHLLGSVDSVESDPQQIIVSASEDSKSTGLPASQPLSFANPLFLYKASARASSSSCTSGLNSSVIQKSYSLSSVVGSGDVGSLPTAGCCRAPSAVVQSSSPERSVLPRQRVGGGMPGWKPSQSNECLADGGGDVVREQPLTRHSAILTKAGLTTKLSGLSSSLSNSTELSVSCDAEQLKQSTAVSNVVGLDTPPDSPHCVSTGHGVTTGRKITPSQNSVRMGVRSMQRRPVEPEKSKIEARSYILATATIVSFAFC